MASFEEFRDKTTSPGQSNNCRPQATESDNSGVTQPLATASRSAVTHEQDMDTGLPVCSVFPMGYRNQSGKAVMQNCPECNMSLPDIHAYITDYANAGLQTEQLRRLTDKPMQRDFKMLNFRYATFCGTFTYRKAEMLQAESGLMVVDIDGMETPEAAMELKGKLCADRHYVTALCCISPLGRGVKWVVERQRLQGGTYRDEMNRIYNYVAFEYGIAIDTSGSDICRACYLPYDKDCYINSKYLKR